MSDVDLTKRNTTSQAFTVQSLVSELKPSPYSSLWQMGLLWCAFCLVLFLTLIFGILGGSLDTWIEVFSSFGMIPAILLIGSLSTGVFAVLLSSVPGRFSHSKFKSLVTFPLFFWVGSASALFLLTLRQQGFEEFYVAKACFWGVMLFSLLPAAYLFFRLRKQAVTRPTLTGAMIGWVSFGAAALAFQFHCPDGNPIHLFVWHYSPALFLTLISAILGRVVFRW
jgi:hypothetical protein